MPSYRSDNNIIKCGKEMDDPDDGVETGGGVREVLTPGTYLGVSLYQVSLWMLEKR